MKKLILLICIIGPSIGYSQTKTEDSTKQAISQNSAPNTVDSKVITKNNNNPKYPGDIEGFAQPGYDIMKFIRKKMIYPKEALENKIEGGVQVGFVILASGKIDSTSIEITKGLGYGTEEEAKRILMIMPKWIPAKNNGKAIDFHILMTILFDLSRKR